MSKLIEYTKSIKACNAKKLEALFKAAIINDDMIMLIRAQSYGRGLQDAYETILDNEEADKIKHIISEKSEEFIIKSGGCKN